MLTSAPLLSAYLYNRNWRTVSPSQIWRVTNIVSKCTQCRQLTTFFCMAHAALHLTTHLWVSLVFPIALGSIKSSCVDAIHWYCVVALYRRFGQELRICGYMGNALFRYGSFAIRKWCSRIWNCTVYRILSALITSMSECAIAQHYWSWVSMTQRCARPIQTFYEVGFLSPVLHSQTDCIYFSHCGFVSG